MNDQEKREEIRNLRKRALALRENLLNRDEKNKKIRENVLNLLKDSALRVFVFASYNDEVDTMILIKEMISAGFSVYCPRVEGKDMSFYWITDLQMLAEGYKGIPEPDPSKQPEKGSPLKEDLMLVPGLLFDREGGRIGYGGGYYDRFMRDHPCIKAGLCFSDQISEEILPQMPWDISVDLLITDDGVINTGKITG